MYKCPLLYDKYILQDNEDNTMKNPASACSKLIISAILFFSCKDNTSHDPSAWRNTDPKRCIAADVGEASDFMRQSDIKDDRVVTAHGLANPQALIWRDDAAKRTYYLARVMGTDKKLYYLKPVADDETPGVASVFEGHFLRWSHLNRERGALLMNALKTNYNVEFDPTKTYIIVKEEKPEGCR